jgi:hypothetical protein
VKDITKLKIWPVLEKEHFKIKVIRVGDVIFGKGAILLPDYKKGFPFVEISPLINGHWRLLFDYGVSSISWEGSPFEIERNFKSEIENFKNYQNEN